MKTKVLLTVIFTAISLCGFSQYMERKTVIQTNEKGTVQSVEFSSEDQSVRIPGSAEVFFRDMLKIQSTDGFIKMPHKSKRKEFVHEHFDQYYNGVRVEGGGYNFHYRNGEMFYAHGDYIRIDRLNTKPAITDNEAGESFARYKGIPLELIVDYRAELIIREIPLKGDTVPMLVYKVYLTADHPDNTETGFVDAQTGKVLITEPSVINYAATGTFATRYSGTQSGITHYYGGAYHLADSTAGRAIIHTWNLNGSTDRNSRVELSDNDNNWTQAEHSSNNNNMALDVHWALQQIRNRLFVTHGMNSFDDNGHIINGYIKDGNNPDNAGWNSGSEALFFGSGGTTFNAVASLDVVAHEFGHGITQFQINWGGTEFNEGLSDIWGAIMEYRIRSNSVWQIGEQIMKNYTCLRNLQNTNDNGAHTKIADTYGTTQYTNGNIYVKSGVFSHWFYLLVNGGSGTNDIGNSYSVTGVGMDNAENLIVEAVFNNYLRNTTSFAQIRTAMVNAAKTLNGGQYGTLALQVEKAWYAVGVGNLPVLSGPSLLCSGSSGTFTVSNAPSGYTWTCSSGLTAGSASGSSKTFTASSVNDGIEWIAVNLGSVELVRKEVWIGKPTDIPTTHSVSIPLNTPTIITPPALTPYRQKMGIAEYDWSWDTNTGNATLIDGPQSATVKITTSGTYRLHCYGRNSCGSYKTGAPLFIINISPGYSAYSMSAYPNPVSGVLNVHLEELETESTALSTSGSSVSGTGAVSRTNPVFTVSLYSVTGTLVLQTTASDLGNIQLDVSSLPNGIYTLHVHDGSENPPVTQHIVIAH
jgi:Zn-dependent metalloprotease